MGLADKFEAIAIIAVKLRLNYFKRLGNVPKLSCYSSGRGISPTVREGSVTNLGLSPT